MASAPKKLATNALRRQLAFVGAILLVSLICYKTLVALLHYSLQDDSSSHIIVIPFVSAVLLYFERRRIFSAPRTSLGAGLGIVAAGAVLYWLAGRSGPAAEGSVTFSVSIFAVLLMWYGAFACCYGLQALRLARFPLLFTLLMIPFPLAVLDRVVYALQSGSTEIASWVFQATGTPVLRNGFVLAVPGVTIEVAKECSSIRSSLALFITCLLAAHLYLRTFWKMAILVVLGLLLSVVKNGVRIATLTMLSIHVNPDFLTGKLHRDGGFVFFFFTLLLLWPVFSWLSRSEAAQEPKHGAA